MRCLSSVWKPAVASEASQGHTGLVVHFHQGDRTLNRHLTLSSLYVILSHFTIILNDHGQGRCKFHVNEDVFIQSHKTCRGNVLRQRLEASAVPMQKPYPMAIKRLRWRCQSEQNTFRVVWKLSTNFKLVFSCHGVWRGGPQRVRSNPNLLSQLWWFHVRNCNLKSGWKQNKHSFVALSHMRCTVTSAPSLNQLKFLLEENVSKTSDSSMAMFSPLQLFLPSRDDLVGF